MQNDTDLDALIDARVKAAVRFSQSPTRRNSVALDAAEAALRARLAPPPHPEDEALIEELESAHSYYQHAPDAELKSAQAEYHGAREALRRRISALRARVEEAARREAEECGKSEVSHVYTCARKYECAAASRCLREAYAKPVGPLTGIEAGPDAVHPKPPVTDHHDCQKWMMANLKAWPRTCPRCKLGPCAYGASTEAPAPADDLVAVLRQNVGSQYQALHNKAADCIEAQAREIAAAMGLQQGTALVVKQLEADNARLREALTDLTDGQRALELAESTGLPIKRCEEIIALASGGDRG